MENLDRKRAGEMMGKIILIAVALALAGCASRSDVIKENYRRDYKSAKSPGALAVCIDQNANNKALNVFRSHITNVEGQPIEVLVRNGDSIAAVVQIAPVEAGSNAVFYLSGASAMFPETATKDFTKGCDQL